MALTPSTMTPLGTGAPPFLLPDTDGKIRSLEEALNQPVLVMFICNHCPYVKHVRAQLAALAEQYQKKGVAIFAINSNDAENYPEDSPEKMKEEKQKYGYTFPYLYDETQSIARSYGAACTPDFFLFDSNHQLVYRGQLDDSRPGTSIPVTGENLRRAMDAVLAGKKPEGEQKPSIGCNIKWKE